EHGLLSPVGRPFYQLTSAQGSRKVRMSRRRRRRGQKEEAAPAVRRPLRRDARGTYVEGLLKLSRAIEAVNFRIGNVLSWLILIVVLVYATSATIRHVLDT